MEVVIHMNDEKNEQVDSPESTQVRLNFRIPSRMPTLYAHHMIVQPGEHEVTISFFEVIPPLVLGGPKEQMKLLQETGIMAECVARITVAKSRYPAFAEAMQQVLSQVTSEQDNTEKEQANADSGGDNKKDQQFR